MHAAKVQWGRVCRGTVHVHVQLDRILDRVVRIPTPSRHISGVLKPSKYSELLR